MIDFLDGIVEPSQSSQPSNLDMVYYMFFEKGISLNEFNELPIPYIMAIISAQNYISKEQEKAQKKAKRGR